MKGDPKDIKLFELFKYEYPTGIFVMANDPEEAIIELSKVLHFWNSTKVINSDLVYLFRDSGENSPHVYKLKANYNFQERMV